MKIGYARVSTGEQNIDLQRRALEAIGVERIVEDRVSGLAVKRPGLDGLMQKLTEGDTLIVWRLDRLGRSLPHLIHLVHSLGASGIGFQSLSENIDTTSASGRLVFHIMGALAEFERALIVERTTAGMAAARARGTHIGRLPRLGPSQIAHARLLVEQGESATAVARSLNVGRSTLYRALRGTTSVR